MRINIHITNNIFDLTKFISLITTELCKTLECRTEDGILQKEIKCSEESTASDEDGY